VLFRSKKHNRKNSQS